MRVLRTSKYPTRYVAWEHPQVFVINRDVNASELAVYTHEIPNSYFSELRDGVFLEVQARIDGGWIINGQARLPDRTREQHNVIEHFEAGELSKAMPRAKALARELERWIVRGVARNFHARSLRTKLRRRAVA